jgi:hypothetical protein
VLIVPEEQLDAIERLMQRWDPGPWTASIEGRDHESGDDFIQTGVGNDRREDICVTRDSGPAPADLDLIALLRTHAPDPIAEVRRAREAGGAHS